MVIGIDIGGTTTKLGLVDSTGHVLARNTFSTSISDFDEYIEALYLAALPLFESAGGKENIVGIGVGGPNGNFYTGNIERAANLPWKGIVPFTQKVKARFSLPCILTNDANAAAVGEMTYGVAQGMKNFIMITLGTGVGSGIVVDGKLLYGHDGFAGELGHVVVNRQSGRLCGCGRRGCLETYCSAVGVARTAEELLQTTTTPSLLRNKANLTSKDVYEAAMQGDTLALDIFSFTGKILGETLADFVAFSAPEAIVLFGGLVQSGDLLMTPVREAMEQNLLPIWKGKIKLLSSKLPASDAAIIGAASLVVSS